MQGRLCQEKYVSSFFLLDCPLRQLWRPRIRAASATQMSVFNTRVFANKLFTSDNVPIDLLCQHLVLQFIAFNIGVHFLMLSPGNIPLIDVSVFIVPNWEENRNC
jgi:hypothetical protein